MSLLSARGRHSNRPSRSAAHQSPSKPWKMGMPVSTPSSQSFSLLNTSGFTLRMRSLIAHPRGR